MNDDCENNRFQSSENKEIADQILNCEFDEDEILRSVKRLKNGKACGSDKILNEFIKASFSKMKHIYVGLFNKILNAGCIPESWTIGMITPIYKNKGDKADFNNYRGITILSCLGKLFTSIINERLNSYSNEVRLVQENQTGFRKNYSTLDHIFLLKNFIDLFVLNENKKLFCAFVDYKKAFDTVWRSGLWYKLLRSGISGKLYNVIVNMYNNIKSCVNCDGQTSEYFFTTNGVRQGENLSPFLFALFVNDIEQFLTEYGCNPIEMPDNNMQSYLKLLIIMYADDTVLFAESKESLQNCLNGLKNYCDKWKLQINENKTKVLIFSKRRPNLGDFCFKIGEKNIEVVDEFCYLGVTFTRTGNFNKNLKTLEKQGNSAIFSIIKQARKESLPIDIQFEMFDLMVLPVILYGCEIWGSANLLVLERLHLKFCKMILKLKRSTPDVMVYGESGRFKIEYYAKKRIINFWSKIALGDEDKLSYKMYKVCKQKYDSSRGNQTSMWFKNLVCLLRSCGIMYFPVEHDHVKKVVDIVHMSLESNFITNWETQINEMPKCSTLYKHIKTVFEREYYVNNLPHNLRIAI